MQDKGKNKCIKIHAFHKTAKTPFAFLGKQTGINIDISAYLSIGQFIKTLEIREMQYIGQRQMYRKNTVLREKGF